MIRSSEMLARLLHRHVVYPSAVALRGERTVFAALKEIEGLQWRSPAALARRRTEQLADALTFAAASVPHYRHAWGAGRLFSPETVERDLAELPLLGRRDVQERAADLTADGYHRVTRKTTGGSTGEAVTLLKDRQTTAREMAASWLGYGWYGVHIGDRAVRFWGTPWTLRRRLRFAAADLAMHRMRLSAFAFDAADMDRYWVRCLRFRPDYFYGYVSMLETFARHITETGRDGRRLGLKVVVTTSEALSEPQRRLIGDTFGCPVQNEYGCGEVGPIAYECPAGALHLMDHIHVELLDREGRRVAPGETGEVVITDLYNRAMPLVRYRVGDAAVLGGHCACGRGLPALQRVWGRAYDFVESPDGRLFHGEFFMYLFEQMRQQGLGVRQFQVRQQAADDLTVALVSDEAPTVAQTLHISETVRQHLGPVRIRVRSVPRIERTRSGKTAVIVNEWRGGTAA